ncbi:DctP family TRAP transporter solute-binding subunit [Anaerobacillus sp. CMMVII]|uniref:TRAP transporter substrate-binding protein n=1 Tax=Anaerobacillus sp. CMMVII TaxID=2755588 RepID=UPI0021B84348|nr:DctP family TRAP transporter solute-binding subunit [Anaerobacillus sp. CMMVII]MCT8140454.1 DctP family TRAP transporter solute-binding subunit [Anaerobacillus sp. CMMVII]
MIFKRKNICLLVLALVLSMVMVACGSDSTGGEGTYNWKFVTEEQQGQVQYEYAQEFANRLHEKSGGQINMEVYEFGGLGSEVNQVELLQSGGVEFAIVSPGFTGTMVSEGQLFALHFLFTDDMELNQKILDESEALNVHLTDKYEQYNIKPLAYWTEGAMQWTGDRPLTTPEDFQGFKMRTQTSPLILRSYEAYGASPTELSWGELYTSLQQGVVQGQENPIFFIEDANFHEVQDYMMISEHNIYVAMTTVNTDFFADLPSEIQEMILETVEEMRPVAYEMQERMNDELLGAIETNDRHPTEIIELTAEQREAFREKALPVRDFFINEVGEDGKKILEMLVEEIDAATN